MMMRGRISNTSMDNTWAGERGQRTRSGCYFSKDIRSMNSSLDGPILVKHNTDYDAIRRSWHRADEISLIWAIGKFSVHGLGSAHARRPLLD